MSPGASNSMHCSETTPGGHKPHQTCPAKWQLFSHYMVSVITAVLSEFRRRCFATLNLTCMLFSSAACFEMDRLVNALFIGDLLRVSHYLQSLEGVRGLQLKGVI